MKLNEIQPIAKIVTVHNHLITIENKGSYYLLRRWKKTVKGYIDTSDKFTIFTSEVGAIVEALKNG